MPHRNTKHYISTRIFYVFNINPTLIELAYAFLMRSLSSIQKKPTQIYSNYFILFKRISGYPFRVSLSALIVVSKFFGYFLSLFRFYRPSVASAIKGDTHQLRLRDVANSGLFF